MVTLVILLICCEKYHYDVYGKTYCIVNLNQDQRLFVYLYTLADIEPITWHLIHILVHWLLLYKSLLLYFTSQYAKIHLQYSTLLLNTVKEENNQINLMCNLEFP